MTRSGLVRLAAFVVVAALAGACGGEGSAAPGAEPSGGSVTTPADTIRPAGHRDVGRWAPRTVADVSRIVPLVGSISEVVFALGLGDNVVAHDISATFAEAAHLPLVTRAHDVSAESVLSLHPTLVLADPETGPPEALDHIRNVGIPVVVIEKATLSTASEHGSRPSPRRSASPTLGATSATAPRPTWPRRPRRCRRTTSRSASPSCTCGARPACT